MKRQLVVLSAAVALAATVSGVAYAVSVSPSVTTNTTDVVRRTTNAHRLPTGGGTQLTVLSATLPAGSWVITADLTTVDFWAADFVRCAIMAGTSTIGTAAVTVGGTDDTSVADLVAIGAIKSSSGFTVSVRCSHDNATPFGSLAPYFDARAILLAHKSPVLSIASQ